MYIYSIYIYIYHQFGSKESYFSNLARMTGSRDLLDSLEKVVDEASVCVCSNNPLGQWIDVINDDDGNLISSCLVRCKIIIKGLLLLLAVPIWLWDRCGRRNSPPASYGMDFIFRRCDGSHVSVDTVHTALLRFSSFSSPRWYHLQSLYSDVVLVSPLYVAKPPQSCFPAPLCDVLYFLSLSDKTLTNSSFLAWHLGVL